MDSDIKKLQASLAESAARRKEMLAKFGFIPLSVLKISRGALSQRMFKLQGEVPNRHAAHGERAIRKSERLERAGYGKQTASNRGNGRGSMGASIMPAELVEFFIKYYSAPGEVYLDPFMGQGVQMQVAKLMGLHYYGYDLSDEFFQYIDAVKEKIDDKKTTLVAINGDSRYPSLIPDGIGDFSFHSPPYWDIEFYGTEAGQLGYNHTYPEFLQGMEDVARAWLPKFKPGAYHVVNVNDFRKDAIYYPYHADTISLFTRAGWRLVDTWIIEGLVGGLSKGFAVSFNNKRYAPKIHEYALVFRKPQ